MVGVLAFYSDDPCSNSAEDISFICKIYIWKDQKYTKRGPGWPLRKCAHTKCTRIIFTIKSHESGLVCSHPLLRVPHSRASHTFWQRCNCNFLQILEFSILPETKFSSLIEAPKIFWAENFGRKSGKIKIVKKKKHVFRFCSIRSKREIKI